MTTSIISLMLFAEMLFLAYVNYSTNINLNILPTSSINITMAYIILFVFAEGVLAGLALLYGHFHESKTTLKEYKRKLEKTLVGADNDCSKVSVLEAKIQVLEKALQSALDKNS